MHKRFISVSSNRWAVFWPVRPQNFRVKCPSTGLHFIRLKAKGTIMAAAAAAALAFAWWQLHRQRIAANQARFDEKCLEQAINTFEGEGGLVRT